MKRFLSLLLASVMMLSLCMSLGMVTALAEDDAEPEHEHVWEEATCTEPKTCSVCGATKGEPKGHKVEEWKITVKATCTEGGEKEGICVRCGETIMKETNPSEHNIEDWKTTVKATCTEGGEKEGVCTICGETFMKETPPKGHKVPDNWKTIKNPTSSDRTRIRVKYCERCGEECKRQVKKLSSKEFKSWYKEKCKNISYEKLARTPNKYEGKKIKFSGYVLQVMEDNYWGIQTTTLRVATKGRWDNVIYVTIYGKLNKRILEDDKITLWGEFNGLKTYTTVLGASVTIPQMEAEIYSIK